MAILISSEVFKIQNPTSIRTNNQICDYQKAIWSLWKINIITLIQNNIFDISISNLCGGGG